MSTVTADPPSPCIGVCQINSFTHLCDGCFRDNEEIALWWSLPPDEKRLLIAELRERRERVLASLWD